MIVVAMVTDCEDLYYSVDVTGNLELVIVIHIYIN